MEALGGAASVIAVVDITANVAKLCSEYYSAVKDAKGEIGRLKNELESLKNVLRLTRALSDKTQEKKLLAHDQVLKQQEQQLTSHFEELEKKLDPGKRKKAMSKFGLRALQWPLAKHDVDKSIQILERFKSIVSMALAADQIDAVRSIDDKATQIHSKLESNNWDATLSKLQPAKNAAYNSKVQDHEDRCLADTRVDLLKQISSWSRDPSGACIFWLNGMAGSGKSTIARTVAHDFAGQGRLGASFFFSRGRGDLRNAEKFFPTIAAQLADSLPSLRPSVSEAVAKHYSASTPGLRDQWRYLISKPLSDFTATSKPPSLVIVIDALDECEGHKDIRLILELIAEVRHLKSIQLRVFITSRPETPTWCGFRNIPKDSHRDVLLHEIAAPVVRHDISIFFHTKLETIRQERGLDPPWPQENDTMALVERAAGLFIFAATVYRFIGIPKLDPRKQLSLIIQETCYGTGTRRVTIILAGSVETAHGASGSLPYY